LDKNLEQFSASPLQVTTGIKSVSSLLKGRLTATVKLHTDTPAGVVFNSGSFVRFPIIIALFIIIPPVYEKIQAKKLPQNGIRAAYKLFIYY
jgi:hypothetical protein